LDSENSGNIFLHCKHNQSFKKHVERDL